MNRVLNWVFMLLGVVGLAAAAFFLYSHFLVDYSLENLELALSVTQKDPQKISPLSNQVYRNVLQDMVLQESSHADLDFESVVLLDFAARSLGEATQKAGYARAQFYLNRLFMKKIPARGELLLFLDRGYRVARKLSQRLLSWSHYWQRKFSPEVSQESEVSDHSALPLLIRAQEKEMGSDLDAAAGLYRQYLSLHPKAAESPMAAVNLSHILIKQRKLNEAERHLREVQSAYAGGEEGRIASALLLTVDSLRRRQAGIDELLGLLSVENDPAIAEELNLKLGAEYLATFQIKAAEKIFEKLAASKNPIVRQKAKFYLGLLYKLQHEYDKGRTVLETLEKEDMASPQMGLGIAAELADIYHQNSDIPKSLEFYKRLSEKATTDISRRAGAEVWFALGELEQAGIYYYELHNAEEGAKHLAQFSQAVPDYGRFGLLQHSLEGAASARLRDLAFEALKKRRVYLAFDLFTKNLNYQPQDAWTHSGLATVYLLFSDLKLAMDFAKKGYEIKPDEYTASVLAYVHSFYEHYDDAIRYGEEALTQDRTYIPARYNLARMLFEKQKYQEALDLLLDLERSFAHVRNLMRAKILNNAGYAYWNLGQREKAAEEFQRALEITPDFAAAKENLAQIQNGGASPQAVNLKE